MLRTRLLVTLNPGAAPTGTLLAIAHGLGTPPDAYWWNTRCVRGVGATYMPAANVPNTVSLWLVNSLGTEVTTEVFALAYQGRLY